MPLSSHTSLATHKILLEPKAPFDFAQSLTFLAQARAMSSAPEVRGGTLTKAVRVNGETVVFCLKSTGTVAAPTLEGALYAAGPLSPERQNAALARIRFFLSLDDDLTPFYALARLDDAFAPVMERFYGYHQVKFPTPFECACWAIITQRTPNVFAYKTRQRLVEALGAPGAPGTEVDGETYGAFPDAAQLLDADPKKILEATNNLRKTERLGEVAKAFLTADESFLRQGPYDEVAKWLKGIRGIGAWSADFIMMRALGRMERTPWTDTGVVEAASSVYAGGLTLHRRHVKQIADLYGEWQGYWLHYLKRAYWG
jgi:DNA-3-methyladenine glycosylase II